MTDSKALKSCPICGGQPEYQSLNITPNVQGRIICSCGLEIMQGKYDTEDDLRIIWNTRHGGTCEVEGSIWHDHGIYDSDYYEFTFTCGHTVSWLDSEPPRCCPECGKEVIDDDR